MMKTETRITVALSLTVICLAFPDFGLAVVASMVAIYASRLPRKGN